MILQLVSYSRVSSSERWKRTRFLAPSLFMLHFCRFIISSSYSESFPPPNGTSVLCPALDSSQDEVVEVVDDMDSDHADAA